MPLLPLAFRDQVEVLRSNLALQMFVKTPSNCCQAAMMFPESSMAIPAGPVSNPVWQDQALTGRFVSMS